MDVRPTDLDAAADRLLDALDVYERFAAAWIEDERHPPRGVAGVADDVADGDIDPRDAAQPMHATGRAVATAVRDRYLEARELEATYRDEVRQRCGWRAIVANTRAVRGAAREVHAAGYSDEASGYRLPRQLCPGYLVSMNASERPATFDHRVAQYEAVAAVFGLEPTVVYYPAAGHDVSPSSAFPDGRVVYADVDDAAMADLRRADHEAVAVDATEHELAGGADLVVLRNPGMMEEPVVAANLRPGGYALVDDHLDSATHLAGLDWLELVGVVPDVDDGAQPTVVTEGVASRLASLRSDDAVVASRASSGSDRPDGSELDRGASPASASNAETNDRLRAQGSDATGSTVGSPLDLFVFRRVDSP
jgi:hypothetical protein